MSELEPSSLSTIETFNPPLNLIFLGTDLDISVDSGKLLWGETPSVWISQECQ